MAVDGMTSVPVSNEVPTDGVHTHSVDLSAVDGEVVLVPASARDARRAGRAFRAIAVTGVCVSLFATVVGWQFLSDLDRNLDSSLTIGEDAAAVLGDTIDVADEVVADLDEGLLTLEHTLDTLTGTATDTGAVAGSAAEIAGRLPASFDGVDDALGTVESISSTIDTALRAASQVPFGPDYDPATPLPEAVADLRAAFAPIGDDLGVLAERLDGFAGNTGVLVTDLADVRADVERTRTSLAQSGALLDRYRETADQAGRLAADSRADLDRSFGLIRLSMLLLAGFVIVAQYVPWWLGRRLTGSGVTARTAIVPPTVSDRVT